MPRKYKRPVRRRRRKRRGRGTMSSYRANNRVITRINKPLLGKTYKTRMIYAEPQLANINPGAGGLAATYIFSCNGLYDPNITGVGHQPNGFDQLMLMYDHYTVIGAKIVVTYNNADATNFQYCGIYLRDDVSAEVDPRVIIENGNGVHTILGPQGQTTSMSTLTLNVAPHKFLGRPNPMSEDDLRGSASSNPTEQCYFHIWGAPNSASDGGNIGLGVRIEYVAVFSEPKNLSLS